MSLAIDIQRVIPAWQQFQSAFPLLHIENDAEYLRAENLLNNLLDVVRDDAAHPLYSLLTVVGDLIEAYEIDHEPKTQAKAEWARASSALFKAAAA